MADWSEWVPFGEALASAPLVPGVDMAREGTTGPIVYVGMAGERAGRTGTGTPKGLRGRLGVYVSGKGLASGLGEAVMDRALADPGWLRERLAEAEAEPASRSGQRHGVGPRSRERNSICGGRRHRTRPRPLRWNA